VAIAVKFFITVLLAGAFLAPVSYAEALCGDRELTINTLKQSGETLAFRGYSIQHKLMIELYTSQAGAWTVLVTHPKNSTQVCIGDHGEGGMAPNKKKGVKI